jgi:exosortase A-associated hydrolase 1
VHHRETPLSFDCAGSQLLGIVTMPTAVARPHVGVIIIVGGPQYRVGSHRQFVQLARALADAGVPCLRFDYRGMGDSDGEPRTFEDIDEDLRAAVDAFTSTTRVSNVFLWGLCDGATAALTYSASDPRVAGVVAANPWARSTASEASVRLMHYYARRFVSRSFWAKFLRGRVNVNRAMSEMNQAARAATQRPAARNDDGYLQRLHAAWLAFERPVLVLLSENDLTAREFEHWVRSHRRRRHVLEARVTTIHRFEGADHTFSDAMRAAAVADATIQWTRAIA